MARVNDEARVKVDEERANDDDDGQQPNPCQMNQMNEKKNPKKNPKKMSPNLNQSPNRRTMKNRLQA